MDWVKGITAFALFFGFIGLAFWKSRGVPKSGDTMGPYDGGSLGGDQ